MNESRRPAMYAVIALLLGGLAVLLVVSILQTRALAGQIRQSQLSNGEVLQIVKDCTQPHGKCFRHGQKRTARAVVGINEGTLRVIVAALTCQEEGYHGDALATCTTRHASR